jgi:hypothetical protein
VILVTTKATHIRRFDREAAGMTQVCGGSFRTIPAIPPMVLCASTRPGRDAVAGTSTSATAPVVTHP